MHIPELGFSVVLLNEVSKKDWRFYRWRNEAVKLSRMYAKTSFQDYGKRMANCATYLEFVQRDGKLCLRACNCCHVRLCPLCQWRRRLAWTARFCQSLPEIERDFPDYRWLFLTLALKNCKPAALRQTIQRMNEAWNKLRGKSGGRSDKFGFGKYWPAVGSVKCVEFTKSFEKTEITCHPHFHCLLLVPPDYHRNNPDLWIPQQSCDEYPNPGWVELWQRSLGVSYRPTAHVKSVKRDLLVKQVKETIKYATKPVMLTEANSMDWLDPGSNELYLETVTGQIHKARFIESYGCLRGRLKGLESEPDLIHVEGAASGISGDDGERIAFAWKPAPLETYLHGYDAYVKLDSSMNPLVVGG